jgi:hypothetical protein
MQRHNWTQRRRRYQRQTEHQDEAGHGLELAMREAHPAPGRAPADSRRAALAASRKTILMKW